MVAWGVVKRTKYMNVIPSTWAFKCNRFPDGLIKKFKARFCARVDRQIEGVDSIDLLGSSCIIDIASSDLTLIQFTT